MAATNVAVRLKTIRTSSRPNVPSSPATTARRAAKFSLVATFTLDGSSTLSTETTMSVSGATRPGRSASSASTVTGPISPVGCGATTSGSRNAR